MMSLVIPFRYGTGDSMELKYSLRSWDKHSPGMVSDVFLVGEDKPGWAFCSTIHCAQDKRLPAVCNVLNKLRTACMDPRVTEDFIYSNDDVYLRAPFREGPFYMRNPPHRNGGIHHKGFQLTFDELDRRGARKPYYDCELHWPVVYNKAKALELLNAIDIKLPYSFRTLYFNLLEKQPAPAADHKKFDWEPPKDHEIVVSSNDNTVGQEKFVKWVKAEYPVKSQWEL